MRARHIEQYALMTDGQEFIWKISAFTRETMPLARLAEYLKELAAMLGEEPRIHLIRVESSSTVPVLKIDAEAVEPVRARAAQVALGIAPADAMQRYRNINRMLRDDKGTAVLSEGTAEIIPFPGKEDIVDTILGVPQPGSLEGRLIKLGGPKSWVPLHLQSPDDSVVTGCYARRDLVKELRHKLLEPIRVYGRGKWNRNSDGEWALDRFLVDSFEPLNDTDLPSAIAELRTVPADWGDDPLAALRSLRGVEED